MQKEDRYLWRLLGIYLLVVVIVFVLWELVERLFLSDPLLIRLHRLYMIGGILSSLVLASSVAWLVTQHYRRTAERIRFLSDYNQALLDQMAVGIQVINERREIEFLNRYALERWGDIRGQRCCDVFLCVNQSECPGLRAIREGVGGETVHQDRWGRLYKVHAVPLRKPDGTYSAIETHIDITEEHALQQQLVRAEKLAAIGQLSAGIAHELRTPLSTIRVAAFDLKEMVAQMLPHSPEEMMEALELIEKNAVRCDTIIRNLLDFARESPREEEEVDLTGILRDCLSMMEKEIALQNITLTTHLEPLPPLWARLEDLQQVFSNLLLNALQAMPEGGHLRVEARRVPSERGDGVEVEVSDTGHGIPEEYRDRIFEPFFTTKEAGKGTGLGLALCKRVLDRMNATIEVESQVGVGTTFTIRFPADCFWKPSERASPLPAALEKAS